MAEGIDSNSSHFRIFTCHVVLLDQLLHFISHRVFAGDSGEPGCFSTSASFKDRTSMTGFNSSKLSGAFPSGKRSAEPSFQGFK
jgi:hypothetical protein